GDRPKVDLVPVLRTPEAQQRGLLRRVSGGTHYELRDPTHVDQWIPTLRRMCVCRNDRDDPTPELVHHFGVPRLATARERLERMMLEEDDQGVARAQLARHPVLLFVRDRARHARRADPTQIAVVRRVEKGRDDCALATADLQVPQRDHAPEEVMLLPAGLSDLAGGERGTAVLALLVLEQQAF